MTPSDDITKAAAAVADAAQLVAAAENEASRHAAMRKLQRVQARLDRLAGAIAAPDREAPAIERRLNLRSQRDAVIDTLDEVGVAMPTRAITQYARARFGTQIAGGRFAPLRRDDENAWRKNPASRPVFIAPALNAEGGEPITRILTLTSWDLAERIIAPRTQRYSFLRLCERVLTLRQQRPDDENLAWLTNRIYAPPRSMGLDAQLAEIREELDLIERLDRPDRETAAARLEGLRPDLVIWGNRGIVGIVEVKERS